MFYWYYTYAVQRTFFLSNPSLEGAGVRVLGQTWCSASGAEIVKVHAQELNYDSLAARGFKILSAFIPFVNSKLKTTTLLHLHIVLSKMITEKKKKFHTKETFRFLNSTYVCVLEIDLAAFPLHPSIVLWLTLCLGLFTPQIQCTHMGRTHFQSITRPNLFIRTFKLHTKWNSSTVVFLDAVSWKLRVQDRKCVPYWYTESNNEADNYIQCVQSRNW